MQNELNVLEYPNYWTSSPLLTQNYWKANTKGIILKDFMFFFYSVTQNKLKGLGHSYAGCVAYL